MALEIEGSNPSVHPKAKILACWRRSLSEENTAEASPTVQSPPEPPSVAPSKPRPPRWLPYVFLAVVPALIVGLAVYALKGESEDSKRTTAVIEGFLEGQASGADFDSFEGQIATGFPDEFPMYGSASTVAAFRVPAAEGTNYIVILSTAAGPEEVLRFYLESLDEDPWQVEAARSSPEFTGLLFSRPDNPDIQGNVTLHVSEIDGRTSIYISLQDVSLAAKSLPTDEPFVLGRSLPLPEKFPDDIPIYAGESGDSTVTVTQFQRSPGGVTYIVAFLTKDGQGDVINFYEEEFGRRGWTVTESDSRNLGFALAIDFSDAPGLEGSILADSFPDDPTFTQVDVVLQVSSRRGRGN